MMHCALNSTPRIPQSKTEVPFIHSYYKYTTVRGGVFRLRSLVEPLTLLKSDQLGTVDNNLRSNEFDFIVV
jgi:hypothetical protein